MDVFIIDGFFFRLFSTSFFILYVPKNDLLFFYDDKDGSMCIYNPFVSSCVRFEVNPLEEYGLKVLSDIAAQKNILYILDKLSKEFADNCLNECWYSGLITNCFTRDYRGQECIGSINYSSLCRSLSDEDYYEVYEQEKNNQNKTEYILDCLNIKLA